MARLALALALALGLAGLAGGCGKPASRPADTSAQAAKPVPKAPVQEEAAPEETYHYSAAGKVDPFRPFGVSHTKRAASRQVSPLCQMDLGQFRLVGLADSPDGVMALVQDSAGRGYIIRRGTEIGSGGGVVKEIGLDGVRIEEQVRDYAGRLHSKTIVLKLVQED